MCTHLISEYLAEPLSRSYTKKKDSGCDHVQQNHRQQKSSDELQPTERREGHGLIRSFRSTGGRGLYKCFKLVMIGNAISQY